MLRKKVTVSDTQGRQHEYVVITVREENGVTYAILSPEDNGTDPNAYVACGYDGLQGDERKYFCLPDDVSQRLTTMYRDEWDIDLAMFQAGDNLAIA